MNWTKHACAFTVASAVGLGGLAVGSTTAQAAPYTPQPRITVNDANPPVGGTIRISVARFGKTEPVVVKMRGEPETIRLVRLHTNREGKARAWVTLPKAYRCGHTLVAVGEESGKTARTFIVIGKASRCR